MAKKKALTPTEKLAQRNAKAIQKQKEDRAYMADLQKDVVAGKLTAAEALGKMMNKKKRKGTP